MDTSRKSLIGKVCCNNCLYYKKSKKNGLTLSVGKCELNGSERKRTERLSDCFTYKNQISFFERYKYE